MPEPVNGQALMMPISDDEFARIREIVYQRIGINLTEQKRSLVVGRLQGFLRKSGIAGFSDYIKILEGDASGEAIATLANRISTNHTLFFRENAHFDFFRSTALPEALERHRARGDKDLRIWCAGCSSGEEPYTLAMVMMELMGMEYSQWEAGVLATDISMKALTTAQEALYPAERLTEVPPAIKKKYFQEQADGRFAVADRVKQEVTFRRFNLMNTTLPFKRPFDMIWCRNVMIYFDQPTRQALVERYYNMTVPGGYLFIGHSESLPRDKCPYRYVMPAVYQKER